MRLVPRCSDRPGSIAWSGMHGSPSSRAGTRPVSWVNVIERRHVEDPVVEFDGRILEDEVARRRPPDQVPAGSERPPGLTARPGDHRDLDPGRGIASGMAGGVVAMAAPTRSPLACRL